MMFRHSITALLAAFATLFGVAHATSRSLQEEDGGYGGGEMCPQGFNVDGRTLLPLEDVLPLPEAAMGLPIDPETGYALVEVAEDTWVLTEGVYVIMFVVTSEGVVLFDAPETVAPLIPVAVESVTDKPITYFIYSHTHQDHVAGAGSLNLTDSNVEIISNDYTAKILAEKEDPRRPVPTKTFEKELKFTVGGVEIELYDTPDGHTQGDIFMYLPQKKTVMVVDYVFPGWVPFRSFAVASNFEQYIESFEGFLEFDAEHYVCGHLNKVGTRAEVQQGLEFVRDVVQAANETLATEEISVADVAARTEFAENGNAWLFTYELERERQDFCYNILEKKWAGVLGGFDIYTRTHCTVAITSLRID